MHVAADTNVLLALAESNEDAGDAFEVLRRRAPQLSRVIPPTVVRELVWFSENSPESALQAAARTALASAARQWHFHAARLNSVQQGIAERVATHLRWRGLLPEEERHDSLIVAEAALLNSALLVTADGLLRGIDFPALTLELRQFDLQAPVIAAPREICRKFFQ